VIEGFGVELNNIEFAAFMIGVAGFALGGGNAGTFTVKTKFSRYVGRDVFVAVEAKPALALFGKSFVATFASLLKFLVCLGNVARADELFEKAFCISICLSAKLCRYEHRKHHDDGCSNRLGCFRHARAYPISNGAPQRHEM
jgi:hypothetical protein